MLLHYLGFLLILTIVDGEIIALEAVERSNSDAAAGLFCRG